jgi:hypothetical protein
MGFNKIQAKYKEVTKALAELDATPIGAFVKEAKAVNAGIAEFKRKLEDSARLQIEAGNLHETTIKEAKSLNSRGVIQLEEMKKLLILAAENPHAPLPKIDELDAEMKRTLQSRREALSMEMMQYFKRLEASTPNPVKVGMTSREPGSKVVYEITVVEPKSTNPNLKGDDLFWFKAQKYDGETAKGISNLKLTDLKKMKFLKTD